MGCITPQLRAFGPMLWDHSSYIGINVGIGLGHGWPMKNGLGGGDKKHRTNIYLQIL